MIQLIFALVNFINGKPFQQINFILFEVETRKKLLNQIRNRPK